MQIYVSENKSFYAAEPTKNYNADSILKTFVEQPQQPQQQQPSILLPPTQENIHSTRDYFTFFSKFPNVSKLDIPNKFLKGPFEYMLFAQEIHVPFFSPQQSSYDAWDPSQAPSPCFMEGYFQYYPTLEPYIEQIRAILLAGLPSVVQQPTEQQSTVFLHVRRGDYVTKSDIHYLQDDTYYETALQHFNIHTTRFLIVSDDIPSCKARDIFNRLPNKEFIENENELEVLAYMATCKGGAICANSTFSWWGAILASPKTVIAPAPHRWGKDIPHSLLPDNWIQI
jgi:hypothetical protein